MTPTPLTVAFRADASVAQGSGHVLRTLTLARAVAARGHDVHLATTVDGLPWVERLVAASGMNRISLPAGELGADALATSGADRVVVDSYAIDSEAISELDQRVPVLAIVDGSLRGIEASLYLEQNLGSDALTWSRPSRSRMLAGPRYALIRPEVVAARRDEPWRAQTPPRVLVFLGGTDATGTIVEVARSLRGVADRVQLTVVAAERHATAVEVALAGAAGVRVVPPTPHLDALLRKTDIVVAAAGTSAWEVATLGLPAVLIGVVANQQASLSAVIEGGLALGIDLVDDPAAIGRLAAEVDRLVTDEELRRQMSLASRGLFDGQGAARVALAIEETGA